MAQSADFEESIDKTLREYHSDYWRSREQGREHAPSTKAVGAHIDR